MWKNAAVLALGVLVFASCNEDDDAPKPPKNESELITDLELTFTPVTGGESFTFTWSDPDGPGGNPPTIETITLPAPGSYIVSIEVFDKSNPNEVESITEEIQEEGDEHQFFFIGQGGVENIFSFLYSDFDENDNPIGLSSVWTFTGPTTAGGQIRVVLRHDLNKFAEGVSVGNIAAAGGETDIDVIFPIVVLP